MMKEQLKEKTKESLASVLPITVIVFLLSATVVPMETGTLLLFLIGAMLLIVGMGIFQLGAELAMTPLGQSIGSQMIKGNKLWATVLICFFMGAIITIAEPDLQVLANQVASIPNNVLIYTVAGGVGIFLVIAFLRILYPEFSLRSGVSFRANCYKCGDKTVHPHFLAWNAVETAAPDFHRPEFFGKMILA